MVIVCLDDTSPVTRDDVSWATWVGNGRNRWYDKHQCMSFLYILAFPAFVSISSLKPLLAMNNWSFELTADLPLQ